MKLRDKVAGGILVFVALAVTSLAVVLSRNSACAPAPPVDADAELMQAVVYRCYGPPDVLSLEAVAKPTPGDDELLVKVHAAAVNPLDWHYLRGTPYFIRLFSGLGAPDYPRIGVDFAGTVEAIGKKVTKFTPGDEVFGGRSGAFAEYVTVGEDRAVVLKPPNVSFEQAASVAIAATTALQALRDAADVAQGQQVLINGASGGVGTFAVQIAKSFGADVVGVCSTRNVELVRSLGAGQVFDYTREDYTASGQQFDVIIDNVGNHSLLANRRAMTPDGILVMVGAPDGRWIRPLARPLTAAVLAPFVAQEFVGILAELRQEDLKVLSDLMETGTVTPVIDRRYSLSEVPAAIAYSEKGHARGKIIINVD